MKTFHCVRVRGNTHALMGINGVAKTVVLREGTIVPGIQWPGWEEHSVSVFYSLLWGSHRIGIVCPFTRR